MAEDPRAISTCRATMPPEVEYGDLSDASPWAREEIATLLDQPHENRVHIYEGHHPPEFKMLGVSILAAFILPIAAVVTTVAWFRFPHLRRDTGFRGLVILSVSVATLEAMLAALAAGFLFLWSLSGGMENF